LADDAEDGLEALPPACALTTAVAASAADAGLARSNQGLDGGFDRRLR